MFGKKLIQLRKDKKMSQRDLAAYLHLSQPSIGAYESEKNEPDFSTLKKIASLFDVSIDYLLSDDEDSTIISEDDRKSSAERRIMFADNLRETRKMSGITQVDMAKALNLSATAYGDYERGRTEPDLMTLRKIAMLLEVSVDSLLDVKTIGQETILLSKKDLDQLFLILNKYHE